MAVYPALFVISFEGKYHKSHKSVMNKKRKNEILFLTGAKLSENEACKLMISLFCGQTG